MSRTLTGGWTTVERGLILPPCDVRIATVREVYQDCVRLDDGELYRVPVKARPVAAGERVLAVVPWDDVAYVDTLDSATQFQVAVDDLKAAVLETPEGTCISKFVHRILRAISRYLNRQIEDASE